MKVHHLNCGTMNPITGLHICHVLLVETNTGLVLVDSGYGLADIADPARRIGLMRHLIRPALATHETAVHQIEKLGYHREDVRHIVMTHLDFDHAGGISDFPNAHIHTTSAEFLAAKVAPSARERIRYRRQQLGLNVKFVEHNPVGEPWRGFAAATELTDIDSGIALIALPGHTRGHAAVAVDAGHRWVLHAGDAFYHHGTIDSNHQIPKTSRATEFAFAHNYKQVRDNHARLAELSQRNDPDLLIVCAHNPQLLEHAQATQ